MKPTKRMKNYIPLIVVISISLLASCAINLGQDPSTSLSSLMHSFMGVFLVLFSMLKLFDIAAFAKGFAKYDLLAKKSRTYGILYPFLELTLGLAYLSKISLIPTYIGTIVLMGFGAIGILLALKKGLNVNCACLGTSLKVPLSTIAVVENVGMVIMAIGMLILNS